LESLRGGDRQGAGQHLSGDPGVGVHPLGDRDLAAVGSELVGLHPAAGGAGVVQPVQLVALDRRQVR